MAPVGSLAAMASHSCYPHHLSLVPDKNTDLCVDKLGTTFCSLKFKVSPFADTTHDDGQSVLGGDKNEINSAHGSLNLYGCLNLNKCGSRQEFVDNLGGYCSVPSCSVFESAEERSVCSFSQLTFCDVANRSIPNKFDTGNLSALCEIPIDQEQEAVEHSMRSEVLFTRSFPALFTCGAGFYRDPAALMNSGFDGTSLGFFDSCVKDDYEYCTVQYDTMVYQGACLPETCRKQDFSEVLRFLCEEVGIIDPPLPALRHRSGANNTAVSMPYTGMETCLDFVDLVPFNLCVTAKMLGCNDSLPGLSDDDKVKQIFTNPARIPYDAALQGNIGHMMEQEVSNKLEYPQNRVARSLSDRRPGVAVGKGLGRRVLLQSTDDFINSLPGIDSEAVKRVMAKVGRRTRSGNQGFKSHNMLTCPRASRMLGGEPAEPEAAGNLGGKRNRPLNEILDWLDIDWSEDTIAKHRYETRVTPKINVRCGGWAAALDDSKFNKSMGVALMVVVFMLPVIAGRGRPWRNVKNNIARINRKVETLGEGDWNHVCGFRAVNMFWIVLGHTFTFSWQQGVDSNFRDALGLIHDYTFQFIVSGQLAVDSFFILSGLMFGLFGSKKVETVYANFLKKWRNRSPLQSAAHTLPFIVLMAIKRYLRLMGTTLIILAFSYWVLPYWGSGPMWVPYVNYLRYGMKPDRNGGCYTRWWNIVTLTNNLIGDADGLNCLGHTWYLSNDYQFYLIGNLVVLVSAMLTFVVDQHSTPGQPGKPDQVRITTRKPFYGALLTIGILTSLYSYYVVAKNHLHFAIPAFSDASLQPSGEGLTKLMVGWANFYIKPWCRIGPYLIGLAAGVCHRDGTFREFITLRAPQPEAYTAIETPDILHQTAEASTAEDFKPALESEARSLLNSGAHTPTQQRSNSFHAAPRVDTTIIHIGNVCAAILLYVCVFTVPYSANKDRTLWWDPFLDRVWFVYNRSLWAFGLAWFALVLSYVPNFAKRLRNPATESRNHDALCDAPVVKDPVSRILKGFNGNMLMAQCAIYTFTFYLVHPLVEQSFYANRHTDGAITNVIGWFTTLPHFVITIVTGVLTSWIIECPLASLFEAIGL